ncbi:MAG: C45 family peptidase [Actinomycetes bacterium]
MQPELSQSPQPSSAVPSPELTPVEAKGTPFERGAIIGGAFREAIAKSVAFNSRYLARHGIDRLALESILTPFVEASEVALPDLVKQIRGIAAGAEQSFLDLFAANAFEEIYGIVELANPAPTAAERCTDVVLKADRTTLLGHNEQWYSGDDGAVGIVRDSPNDGPVLLAPVVAGTLPLVGLNEYGAAFGTMSLSAKDERPGIPRALVARSLLDAVDPADAFKRANRSGRAGGYSYLCTFAGGESCVIETTATTAALVSSQVHTNHALDPDVAKQTFEVSDGSASRLRRAQSLASGSTATVEDVSLLLADHAGEDQSICVHPDPVDGDEGSTILFAMICESESRSMWLSPGHPCSVPFQRFHLDPTP